MTTLPNTEIVAFLNRTFPGASFVDTTAVMLRDPKAAELQDFQATAGQSGARRTETAIAVQRWRHGGWGSSFAPTTGNWPDDVPFNNHGWIKLGNLRRWPDGRNLQSDPILACLGAMRWAKAPDKFWSSLHVEPGWWAAPMNEPLAFMFSDAPEID